VPGFNPHSLDPLWGQTLANQEAAFMVFDTLYGLDASLAPQPQMVEGHDLSADQRVWRFTLREGQWFHDGEPVRARDAVTSIGRWAQRAPLGVRMKTLLDELRVIDDRQFEIRLQKPFPHLLYGLGRAADCLVRPERVAAHIDAFTDLKDYTGSGPYVFLPDEWVFGARLAFRRNEHYVPRQEQPSLWAGGKVVNFDRVEWTIMPDIAATAGALEKAEVDWWGAPSLDLAPRLRTRSGVTVEQLNPFGWWALLRLNTKVPPFDDPALRRALFPAVDQSDYMLAAVGEQVELMRTGVGLFAVESPLRTDVGMEVLTGPRDLDLARRMVKAAGYTGAPIVQMAPADVPRVFALNGVAHQMMTAVGLKVDYQAIDMGTYSGRIGSNSWNCYCMTLSGASVLDPGTHISLFGPLPDPDPQMKLLRDAWFDAPDLPAQQTIADRMQLRAFEDPPFVPLGEYFTPAAFRSDLSGFVPSYASLFWNVRRG